MIFLDLRDRDHFIMRTESKWDHCCIDNDMIVQKIITLKSLNFLPLTISCKYIASLVRNAAQHFEAVSHIALTHGLLVKRISFIIIIHSLTSPTTG